MRTARPLAAAVAVAALVVAGAAACSSSGDGSSGSATSTTVATGTDGATTTTAAGATTTAAADTTTTEADASADLVGSWVADADSILGANLANLGGAGGFECHGPVTLTFTAQGTFTHTSTATCTAGGLSATATIDSSGRYRAGPRRLLISGARNGGSITVGGATTPLRVGFADGLVAYQLDGDTLTFTFTVASVGTVTQTYTRA
jgi:hypothetical protein